MKNLLILSLSCCAIFLTSCVTMQKIRFPDSDDLFITTGDGDITEPYEPIGHLLFVKSGFRLGFLPILGMIPIADVVAENEIKDVIAQKTRAMGGNAVINLEIKWQPPSNGFLGLGAKGGMLYLKGMVIRQRKKPGEMTLAEKTPIATPTIQQRPTSRVSESTDILKALFQGTPAHSPSLTYANLSGDGGGGIRFGYAMRRRDTKFAFTPAISYGTHTNTVKQQFSEQVYNPTTRQYELIEFEVRQTKRVKLIPIELNVTTNLAAFPGYAESLPDGLNPYLETGLTYYFWGFDYELTNTFNDFTDSFNEWHYFDLGLNLGLGVEYAFKPGLSVWGGLKRYFVFTEGDIQTWNVQFGVSLY